MKHDMGLRLGTLLLIVSVLSATAGATEETMILKAIVLQNEAKQLTTIPEGDGETIEIFNIVVSDPDEDEVDLPQEDNDVQEEADDSADEAETDGAPEVEIENNHEPEAEAERPEDTSEVTIDSNDENQEEE